MTAQIPQVPQTPQFPQTPQVQTAQVQTAQVPQGGASRLQTGWALGLAIAAIVISCFVAALLIVQVFFGWLAQPHGWFAYAPGGVDMGEPSPFLNEGVVLVDAEGGVSGGAIAGALQRDLGPGVLTCQDVAAAVVDAASVCTYEEMPDLKVVVLFVNDSGRFVWSQVPLDSNAYLPPD